MTTRKKTGGRHVWYKVQNQVRAILQNDDIEIRDTNLKRIQEKSIN